jgi:ribosomal protein S18 acetylase RimI-like enzyme
MTIELVRADIYSVEELTEAYNHTRVDYMVPMPMNAAKLREYIHLYNVHLDKSLVAKNNGNIVGLGMLAVRPNRSWITRLGLVANSRGKGDGEALMRGLLQNSDDLGIEKNLLEVIHGNLPAQKLFQKLDFHEKGELLILRRAPKEMAMPSTKVNWLEQSEAIPLLLARSQEQAWTNQTESLEKARGLVGFTIITPTGGRGWMIFQRTLFNLSRLMFMTQDGDPVEIMRELLRHLHHNYPNLDTYTENIPADDPHLPAFYEIGYFEAFRRIEMHRYPKNQP